MDVEEFRIKPSGRTTSEQRYDSSPLLKSGAPASHDGLMRNSSTSMTPPLLRSSRPRSKPAGGRNDLSGMAQQQRRASLWVKGDRRSSRRDGGAERS